MARVTPRRRATAAMSERAALLGRDDDRPSSSRATRDRARALDDAYDVERARGAIDADDDARDDGDRARGGATTRTSDGRRTRRAATRARGVRRARRDGGGDRGVRARDGDGRRARERERERGAGIDAESSARRSRAFRITRASR